MNNYFIKYHRNEIEISILLHSPTVLHLLFLICSTATGLFDSNKARTYINTASRGISVAVMPLNNVISRQGHHGSEVVKLWNLY